MDVARSSLFSTGIVVFSFNVRVVFLFALKYATIPIKFGRTELHKVPGCKMLNNLFPEIMVIEIIGGRTFHCISITQRKPLKKSIDLPPEYGSWFLTIPHT